MLQFVWYAEYTDFCLHSMQVAAVVSGLYLRYFFRHSICSVQRLQSRSQIGIARIVFVLLEFGLCCRGGATME